MKRDVNRRGERRKERREKRNISAVEEQMLSKELCLQELFEGREGGRKGGLTLL